MVLWQCLDNDFYFKHILEYLPSTLKTFHTLFPEPSLKLLSLTLSNFLCLLCQNQSVQPPQTEAFSGYLFSKHACQRQPITNRLSSTVLYQFFHADTITLTWRQAHDLQLTFSWKALAQFFFVGTIPLWCHMINDRRSFLSPLPHEVFPG